MYLLASLTSLFLRILQKGSTIFLYFSYGGKTIKAFGSYETGFNENDGNQSYWPIPNVLGIVKRNGPLQ